MEEYTTEEKNKLIEFREIVSDILTTEDQKHDANLIRWLRARSLDLKKSEEMLRDHIEWRKVNKVDGILDREDLPEEFKAVSPFAICGTTPEGFPILLFPMGRTDYRKAIEKYGKEEFARYNIINMEKCAKILEDESKKQGKKITQCVEICDLAGYSYSQIASKLCRESMAEMQKTFDSNYPELLRYAIMINAPKIFAVLFNMMKPFISKLTLDKIDIYGPDQEKWRKVVAEKFPLELIPPHWGGTREGKDEFCSGSDIWIQGPEDLRPFMNGLSESDADYTVATINAREKMHVEFDVTIKDTVLEWKFKTRSHDIGFQLTYTPAGKQVVKDVLPYTRVDAQNSLQEGSHICEALGNYRFTFDNTFSLVNSKTLLYDINSMDPEPEFKDCADVDY